MICKKLRAISEITLYKKTYIIIKLSPVGKNKDCILQMVFLYFAPEET